MVRRLVCGVVVVVAVIFGSLGWTAPAMAKQPSDYYLAEFVPAEFGAIAGGVIAGFASFSLTGLIWVVDGKEFYDYQRWALVLGGWGMGRAFGAGLGATWTGESYGIQGNVIMAYLLPGVSLVVLPISWFLGFLEASNINPLAIPHLPLVPAVLAVIGFNMGAKVKDTGQPASLPWSLDLPVLSLEF